MTVLSRQTKNLTGRRFGHLQVLHRVGSDRHGASRWLVVCSCGAKKTVTAGDLASMNTTSCGCANSKIGFAKPKPLLIDDH
jgi:hypothetical protein